MSTHLSPDSSGAPRPSSLRALIAWFFVLSFRDYKDPLEQSSYIQKIGDRTCLEHRLKHLVWWPPDVFALTSIILARTGAYRMVVGPTPPLGRDLWQRLDWQAIVKAHAIGWRNTVSDHILKSPTCISSQHEADREFWLALTGNIKERCTRLRIDPFLPPRNGAEDHDVLEAPHLLADSIKKLVTLNDDDGPLADQNLLAIGVKSEHESGDASKFIEAIIALHTIADAAAGSIGMPRSSAQASAVFDCMANIMLTLRGSLSTVSKFHGVVLPKLRTPQVGLTLRNLSHNLTFHDCEVEVMWRSFPWANVRENTFNILYVPYPFDFDPKRFKGDISNNENIGYFTYQPGDWKQVGSVVALIDKVLERGVEPHMLVFTETAFNEKTYKRLITALTKRFAKKAPRLMPIVLAGIAKKDKGKDYNELRLATYFAGKWYLLTQHKHHRWQLNADQINQYGLQGRLSTARPLFENIVVDQRRLTFFAPSPWLVLSPLICEDLARLEPVSELIRGVAPTLVLAALLDGPQLANRWAGRYASVLADDPGTAVLTLTSFGIANASKPLEQRNKAIGGIVQKSASDLEPGRVVTASWKHASSGFQAVASKTNEALLFTLTADFGDEFTLDRRSLRRRAVGFRLDGVSTFEIPKVQETQKIDEHVVYGNWSDIRELSTITHVACAALSLLRPHQSTKCPRESDRCDTWDGMFLWETRCRQVRQLLTVAVGEAINDTGQSPASDEPIGSGINGRIKRTRDELLNHLFPLGADDVEPGAQVGIRARNRHLFSVICFAQEAIEVEVRDPDAKWPAASLDFASVVLSVLLDSICGGSLTLIDALSPSGTNGLDQKEDSVYRKRLRIAAYWNRFGNREKVLSNALSNYHGDDVDEAPKPLLNKDTAKRGEIKYLSQFKDRTAGHVSSTHKLPEHPLNEPPNRYDFYLMILRIVNAILQDKDDSLWLSCRQIFQPESFGNQHRLDDTEMRRLTLLVLMLLPALIHEQLEFEYINIKRSTEVGLNMKVIHDLMQEANRILVNAEKETGRAWDPYATMPR